eukprot:3586485-Amphidinium_carterae.1
MKGAEKSCWIRLKNGCFRMCCPVMRSRQNTTRGLCWLQGTLDVAEHAHILSPNLANHMITRLAHSAGVASN